MHYTAPWHQQENVFLPSSRPPCVEDLHRQAKLNLKSVLRGKMLLQTLMCSKGTVVFTTVFANVTELQTSEGTCLFFCLQHIRNIEWGKMFSLSRDKEICYLVETTLEWKRGRPGVSWPFPFSLWSVSKMAPSTSIIPELFHLYFSVRTTTQVFHLVICCLYSVISRDMATFERAGGRQGKCGSAFLQKAAVHFEGPVFTLSTFTGSAPIQSGMGRIVSC